MKKKKCWKRIQVSATYTACICLLFFSVGILGDLGKVLNNFLSVLRLAGTTLTANDQLKVFLSLKNFNYFLFLICKNSQSLSLKLRFDNLLMIFLKIRIENIRT